MIEFLQSELAGITGWTATAWTFVSMLVGGIITHRLSLGRDIRNERNALAREIHSRLLKGGGLDPIDAALFEQLLPMWRRHRFRRAVRNYDQARANHGTDPDFGRPVYTKEAATELAARVSALLKQTRQQR